MTQRNHVTQIQPLSLIGKTPLLELDRITPEGGATIYAKLEAANLGGSVKDRPALAMIRTAEEEGKLSAGDTIIEATSGNTGISLAMIAAIKGYRCVLVMPEDMSHARRHLLKSYGAEIELTDAKSGMAGAVAKARSMTKRLENSFMPCQFENPANPLAHEQTTAIEIWEGTSGHIDAFVAGVGTGGTISGVGKFLKAKDGNKRVVAVEPAQSPVLSGGAPGLHGIQGLGAGFVPAVFDRRVVDSIETVSDLEAQRMAMRLSQEQGLLVGTSSGANVHAAAVISKKLGPGKVVVTILCDTGERYLC